jgi:hypothetical protein
MARDTQSPPGAALRRISRRPTQLSWPTPEAPSEHGLTHSQPSRSGRCCHDARSDDTTAGWLADKHVPLASRGGRHALQCGFCTAGFLTTITAFLADHPDPDDAEITEAIGGNLCRCTGYQNIKSAVRRAAEIRRERSAEVAR